MPAGGRAMWEAESAGSRQPETTCRVQTIMLHEASAGASHSRRHGACSQATTFCAAYAGQEMMYAVPHMVAVMPHCCRCAGRQYVCPTTQATKTHAMPFNELKLASRGGSLALEPAVSACQYAGHLLVPDRTPLLADARWLPLRYAMPHLQHAVAPLSFSHLICVAGEAAVSALSQSVQGMMLPQPSAHLFPA